MEPPKDFQEALQDLINGYSLENESDTPDFVLAMYLQDCLNAFNLAINVRTRWYKSPPSRGKQDDKQDGGKS